MNPKCKKCSIRQNCDWLFEACQLTHREVAERPDFIGKWHLREVAPNEKANAVKRHNRRVWLRTMFKPETGMAVKYDKRRKPDNPRRQWERGYRNARNARLREVR